MEPPEPGFEPLICHNHAKWNDEAQFNPVAHDLIMLSEDGRSKIAKNAPLTQMLSILRRFNRIGLGIDSENDNEAAVLMIFRFDEDDVNLEGRSPASSNWSQLWPVLDCCDANGGHSLDFVSKLRQEEQPCDSSISRTSFTNEGDTVQCTKISYSFNFLYKHIIIVHHFHNINGETKEIIRMVTCGVAQDAITAFLHTALLLIHAPYSETGADTITNSQIAQLPHPKSIICGKLLCIEEWCRQSLSAHQDLIQKIWDTINEQRDPTMRQSKGFEIQSAKLGKTIIDLIEVRQKVQYLLASIASLQEMPGLPTVHNSPSNQEASFDLYESRVSRRWFNQLQVVTSKLLEVQKRCQHDLVKIGNLQERVKGILTVISILQLEIENDRAARMRERDELASKYQITMLARQELIAVRMKRDNTVMKVIAVLSALFLPGTFIATVFSVPIFNWDQENPIGRHFRIYWYFTAPITAVVLFGLSIWLLKMRQDDLKEDKIRMKDEAPDDPEFKGGSTSTL